ncbi:lantibiotic dehydratase family protein [Embleya sp. NPDC055664]
MHPIPTAPPLPDPAGSGPDAAAAWAGWLRRVWAMPRVVEAIAHASPVLDARVRALCAARVPDAGGTRAAALSVARYLRRMAERPTPAGLFGGIAPVRFGEGASVRWGHDHRGVARADARWLASVIDRLESTPGVVRSIPVVANDTVFVRGGRLVVPYGPGADPAGPAVEVSLRHTGPLRTALELAAVPIVYADLESRLGELFPGVARERVAALVRDLVTRRVLLTALRAPATEADALGYVLRILDAAGVDAGADALRQVHTLLARHRDVGVGHSAGRRSVAAARMREVQECVRHPVAVDVRLDADVVLPAAVAREVESAARLLARSSPLPHGSPAWADYHRRFYRRYGAGALVPLLDLVADDGIGWPDGYPGTSVPERALRRGERDRVLSALAQQAALEGCTEVVADEALWTSLAPADASQVWLPPHLEVVVRVEAADVRALDRGDFRVVVSSVSRAAGVVAGRFLDVLEPSASAEFAAAYARLPAGDAATVTARLSFPPLDPAAGHVARTSRVSSRVVSLAEHRDRLDPDVVTARDLVVGADAHRLYLAVPKWGRRVEAWALHALNLRRHTPPLARLVTELSRATCCQVVDFDWGAAAHLPFLPRVRAGRVVLSPARWRLEAAEVPGRSAPWALWDERLTEWRLRRRLPARVVLVDGDRGLPLEMDEVADRVLLREHLRKRSCAVLEEAPTTHAHGWLGGGRTRSWYPSRPPTRRPGRALRRPSRSGSSVVITPVPQAHPRCCTRACTAIPGARTRS